MVSVKIFLSFASEVPAGMFILILVISYICSRVRVFRNSNSNKRIHEKLHFTLYSWTYLLTSKTQFKIEYFCDLLDLKSPWNNKPSNWILSYCAEVERNGRSHKITNIYKRSLIFYQCFLSRKLNNLQDSKGREETILIAPCYFRPLTNIQAFI